MKTKIELENGILNEFENIVFNEGALAERQRTNEIIDELKADDLAYGYKDYEKLQEGKSSMEICNDNENCNSFVIKKIKDKLKAQINSLPGFEPSGTQIQGDKNG